MAERNASRRSWASDEMQSVLDGNIELLHSLLKKRKDVDAIPCMPPTYTLLHIASGLNYKNIVELLLKSGADPNKRSHSGITPLHISVIWDHSEILLCLLEYGGDPSLKDGEGNDAYTMAQQNKANKCFEILQKHKENILQNQTTNIDSTINKTYVLNVDAPTQRNTSEHGIANESENTDYVDKIAQKLEKQCKISSEGCAQDVEKLSNNAIRESLIAMGDSPGPVVDSTRKIYIRRLGKFKSKQDININVQLPGYPSELSLILEEKLDFLKLASLEKEMHEGFENSQNVNWREGTQKCCFNYFLLDSRVTRDLPSRVTSLSFREIFQTFVLSIFYVGKGTQGRPHDHLHKAVNSHQQKNLSQLSSKIKEILDIWDSGHGVISLHCFHNLIPVEAYTREACIVEVLGLSNLTNQRRGNYYGVACNWSLDKKQKFGAYLLYRAMLIFLNDGEREIYAKDLLP